MASDMTTTLQELWIVQEMPQQQVWKFICKTLYDLPANGGKMAPVERVHIMHYNDL